MYRLSFSKYPITPTLPAALSGYYPLRTAQSIHDELWVRTHVFLNEALGEMVVFSAFDLVAVDVQLKEKLQETLERQYPQFAVHVFVSATHTHSAPAGTLDTRKGVKQSFAAVFGEFDEEYFTFCLDQCLASIAEAVASAEPFHYRLFLGEVEGVGADRHDAGKAGDSALVVLEFELEGRAKSLLYVYSCHPTVLSQENRQVSADLPWGVSRLLEDEYEVVQFVNGNSGNLSTRFTRESADFAQVALFGEMLAGKIKKVQSQPLQQLERLSVRTERAVLKAKGKSDVYLDILATEYLADISELAFDYSLIGFDGLLFLTVPGEITSDLVLPLRKQFPQLFTFGYTNDYLFYFASKSMYETGEYEALSSFLQKGEMEKLMDKISKQIEGII